MLIMQLKNIMKTITKPKNKLDEPVTITRREYNESILINTLSCHKINNKNIELNISTTNRGNLKTYGVEFNKLNNKIEGCHSKYKIRVIGSPNGNCQISSICEAQNLLFIVKEEALAVLEYIQNAFNSQILIDVKSQYYIRILDIINESAPNNVVVFENDYENPTGSDMTMALIKWDKNYLHEDHPDHPDNEWWEDDDDY